MVAMAVILLVLAVMGSIFLAVFFHEIKNHFKVVLPQVVATVPLVKLNFTVIDSDRVAQLQPFVVGVDAAAPAGKEDPFVPYYPLIVPKR